MKNGDHVIWSHHFTANRWENSGNSDRLYFFFRSKIPADGDYSHEIKRPLLLGGKTIALNRQTFVGKVMSLLFNILSRLLITFLPRSKHLLISWLQSPYAVILEAKNIKSDTVSTVSPSISHEVMGPDAMI